MSNSNVVSGIQAYLEVRKTNITHVFFFPMITFQTQQVTQNSSYSTWEILRVNKFLFSVLRLGHGWSLSGVYGVPFTTHWSPTATNPVRVTQWTKLQICWETACFHSWFLIPKAFQRFLRTFLPSFWRCHIFLSFGGHELAAFVAKCGLKPETV